MRVAAHDLKNKLSAISATAELGARDIQQSRPQLAVLKFQKISVLTNEACAILDEVRDELTTMEIVQAVRALNLLLKQRAKSARQAR